MIFRFTKNGPEECQAGEPSKKMLIVSQWGCLRLKVQQQFKDQSYNVNIWLLIKIGVIYLSRNLGLFITSPF